MNSNILASKSLDFSVRVVGLSKFLVKEKNEFVLSKQILRSGTAIGALIRESIYAQSTADFINKLHISVKEASETQYWLELLFKTDYINLEMFESMQIDCVELLKLLTASIKTAKAKLNK